MNVTRVSGQRSRECVCVCVYVCVSMVAMVAQLSALAPLLGSVHTPLPGLHILVQPAFFSLVSVFVG